MKLPALLLAGSLVANVALVSLFALRPSLAPPAFRDYFESASAHEKRLADERRVADAATASRARAEARLSAEAKAKLWGAFASDDLRALVARLKAAGFPPTVVRAIVSAEIDRRFAGRMSALTAEMNAAPYWKPRYFGMTDTKLMEERNQLMRERMRAMREVLGDDFFATAEMDVTTAQRAQFGDMPKSKIDLVQRINDDYAEMISDVRTGMRGIVLPEDSEKLALLEREKLADLANVLTPEELADYEMRTSSITRRLRPTLALMDASEAEFKTIFALQKKYDDQINPLRDTGGMMVYTGDMMQQRREAETKLNAEMQAVLGEARAAEFIRDSNFEFRQLAQSAQRDHLGIDAAVRAFDLRNAAAEESQRIAADPALNGEQKRAALKTLAENTKSQLIATLGANTGNAYVGSARWLQAIERGSTVTFNGTSTSYRTVSDRPAPRN